VDHIESALCLATQAHLGQKRKHSGIPYVTHCVEVMKRVSDYGVPHESILSASLLHDVEEDAPEFSSRVKEEFGPFVYMLMMQCSRPERDDATEEDKYRFLCSFERKHIYATIIKIADRYCNVMDYMHTPGKEEYAAWYALQAYPLYRTFLDRVKEKVIDLENDILNRILFDVMHLQQIIVNIYPKYTEMRPYEIRNIVVRTK